MEAQILQELHCMNQKMDQGFSSVNQRLDGFGQRFEVVDERFFKLKDRVDDYMSLTVQNTIAIYELKEAVDEIRSGEEVAETVSVKNVPAGS